MNWKLTDNKNWDSLEQQFQWVQDMNFVMQHHLHHEEGSVAVHTRIGGIAATAGISGFACKGTGNIVGSRFIA